MLSILQTKSTWKCCSFFVIKPYRTTVQNCSPFSIFSLALPWSRPLINSIRAASLISSKCSLPCQSKISLVTFYSLKLLYFICNLVSLCHLIFILTFFLLLSIYFCLLSMCQQKNEQKVKKKINKGIIAAVCLDFDCNYILNCTTASPTKNL